ncbi:MAG: DNA-directed RNA polymerase subunit H [Candidatus Aenigmarchaeota archaeon]|nr:DNA-directed RNA polymerase subunit H [Candidatus Aenigmarchaeota archaeon]
MTADILKHQFVPLHEILPKKEVKELLEKLEIEKDRLPKVTLTDPVVKLINAKQGDVLKITRNSPTAGKISYYRVVV